MILVCMVSLAATSPNWVKPVDPRDLILPSGVHQWIASLRNSGGPDSLFLDSLKIAKTTKFRSTDSRVYGRVYGPFKIAF
jgi:hypothetical protein